MRSLRSFAAVILPVLLALCAGGCKPASDAPPAPSGQVLRVPRYYWPGNFWVDLAHQKGWFKDAGLNVEIVDSNPDFVGSLKDVAAGRLACQGFALFDLMNFNNKSADLVMVICSDQSAGADGIAARPGLTTLGDLRGRKIGVPKDSYSEYLLDVVLDRAGLTHADVKIVDVQGEQAVAALTNRLVDAVCTWGPFVSQARDAVQGALLWDTSKIPGVAPVGWCFRRQFIQERPRDVAAVVRVWQRATQFIKDKPDDAFGIIADIYKKPPAEVKAFAQTDKILDLRDNLLAFSFAAGFDSLHGAARQINEFMVENGLTTNRLDSTRFLDARFVRELK